MEDSFSKLDYVALEELLCFIKDPVFVTLLVSD